MPISIPTSKQPPLTREPRNLFLYGRTKVAKSTIASLLPDALHIDMEEGTGFLTTRRVLINTPEELVELVNALEAEYKKAPWKFLVIDTIDKLDDWCDAIATADYRRMPVGKSFGGISVRELDRGAGYFYLREAFKRFLNKLLANQLWKTVFIGHVRDKYSDGTSKLDTQVKEVDVDLAGKTKSIMCARMDAIGYVYRDAAGKLFVSFSTSDQVNCGNRSPYLAGKVVPFSTPAVLKDWVAIYPDTVGALFQAATPAAPSTTSTPAAPPVPTAVPKPAPAPTPATK